MRRCPRLGAAVFAALLGSFAPTGTARADAPASEPASTWSSRYDAARARMIDGHWMEAEAELRALAAVAENDFDRRLALEMADLAHAYAAHEAGGSAVRTTDELTLLYATAFLYGAGTGAWYVLQTQPDSAFTATLPFAIMTAGPVAAVAIADGHKKMARGVPHSIAAGAYIGLGEGLWLVAFEHARSSRIESENPSTDIRWGSRTVSTVLWGGASLGAVLGGAIGSSVETTPGRVSFAVSRALWAGTLTGLSSAALLPDDAHREERAYALGGVGYNAGLAAGLLLAGDVSPSVARVRTVDLLGLAGGLSSAGLYLGLARHPDVRVAEGAGALGAGAGLALGWIATRGMKKEVPSSASRIVAEPTVSVVRGGGTIGLAGVL